MNAAANMLWKRAVQKWQQLSILYSLARDSIFAVCPNDVVVWINNHLQKQIIDHLSILSNLLLFKSILCGLWRDAWFETFWLKSGNSSRKIGLSVLNKFMSTMAHKFSLLLDCANCFLSIYVQVLDPAFGWWITMQIFFFYINTMRICTTLRYS